MSVVEIRCSYHRGDFIRKFERKSKSEAIRELVDYLEVNWNRVDRLEAELAQQKEINRQLTDPITRARMLEPPAPIVVQLLANSPATVKVPIELAERLASPLKDDRGWVNFNTADYVQAATELRALLNHGANTDGD